MFAQISVQGVQARRSPIFSENNAKMLHASMSRYTTRYTRLLKRFNVLIDGESCYLSGVFCRSSGLTNIKPVYRGPCQALNMQSSLQYIPSFQVRHQLPVANVTFVEYCRAPLCNRLLRESVLAITDGGRCTSTMQGPPRCESRNLGIYIRV